MIPRLYGLGGIAVARAERSDRLAIGRSITDSRHAALRRPVFLRAEFLTAMR